MKLMYYRKFSFRNNNLSIEGSKTLKEDFVSKCEHNYVPITMNMFVRYFLVLILSVALGQTLKCYNCNPCKDGKLGEVVDCDGVCFKIGDIFVMLYLHKIPQKHIGIYFYRK